MAFFIGVLIFILFIVFCYFFIKRKIEIFFGGSLGEIIKQARIEDEQIPKSLSSMDRIYMEQILKDFPNININELKRKCEKNILEFFSSIEKKDSSNIDCGKVREDCNKVISSYGKCKVNYNNFKIHNTVVSKYSNNNGIATIYFSSSFEYILIIDGKEKKVQDRARVEFIYIVDSNLVESSKKLLGLNCPNCGSPITNLGYKKCSYCGTSIVEIVSKVWTYNDMIRY